MRVSKGLRRVPGASRAGRTDRAGKAESVEGSETAGRDQRGSPEGSTGWEVWNGQKGWQV